MKRQIYSYKDEDVAFNDDYNDDNDEDDNDDNGDLDVFLLQTQQG